MVSILSEFMKIALQLSYWPIMHEYCPTIASVNTFQRDIAT